MKMCPLGLIVFIYIFVVCCTSGIGSNFRLKRNYFPEDAARTLENKKYLTRKIQANSEFNPSIKEKIALDNMSISLSEQVQKRLVPNEVAQTILRQSSIFPKLLKSCGDYNSYYVKFDNFNLIERGKYVVRLQCTTGSFSEYAYFSYSASSKESLKPIELVVYDYKGEDIVKTSVIGTSKFNSSTKELSVTHKCISRESCGDIYIYTLKGYRFIIKQIIVGRIGEDTRIRYEQVYPKR